MFLVLTSCVLLVLFCTVPLQASYRCEALTMKTCKGRLGYNETTLPNLLNHSSQEEAERELQMFSYWLDTGCSPHLGLFLCLTYAPPCSISAIPPCRSLCEEIKEQCHSDDFVYPQMLDCIHFPEEGLCVDPGKNSGVSSSFYTELHNVEETVPNVKEDKVPLRCEPLTIPFCKDHLGYNVTLVPSTEYHSSQEEAERDLRMFDYFLETGCSPHLRRFLCLVYAPPCNILGEIIPPCRSFCEHIRGQCHSDEFVYPQILDCSGFPDREQEFCELAPGDMRPPFHLPASARNKEKDSKETEEVPSPVSNEVCSQITEEMKELEEENVHLNEQNKILQGEIEMLKQEIKLKDETQIQMLNETKHQIHASKQALQASIEKMVEELKILINYRCNDD